MTEKQTKSSFSLLNIAVRSRGRCFILVDSAEDDCRANSAENGDFAAILNEEIRNSNPRAGR
jgi:hypothetical protein